jgi:hypothetical protein
VLGIPELIVIMTISGLWLIPLAAVIWGIVTLHRLRVGQESLQAKLEAIERLLQRA